MLLQVVFHARVAEEAGAEAFDIDTVAGLLVEKLVRRHPHVFADGDASTPAEVEQAWERIKAQEKGADADGGAATRPTCCTASPRHCPATSPPRRCWPGSAGAGLTPTPDAVARLERARAALARPRPSVRASRWPTSRAIRRSPTARPDRARPASAARPVSRARSRRESATR